MTPDSEPDILLTLALATAFAAVTLWIWTQVENPAWYGLSGMTFAGVMILLFTLPECPPSDAHE